MEEYSETRWKQILTYVTSKYMKIFFTLIDIWYSKSFNRSNVYVILVCVSHVSSSNHLFVFIVTKKCICSYLWPINIKLLYFEVVRILCIFYTQVLNLANPPLPSAYLSFFFFYLDGIWVICHLPDSSTCLFLSNPVNTFCFHYLTTLVHSWDFVCMHTSMIIFLFGFEIILLMRVLLVLSAFKTGM